MSGYISVRMSKSNLSVLVCKERGFGGFILLMWIFIFIASAVGARINSDCDVCSSGKWSSACGIKNAGYIPPVRKERQKSQSETLVLGFSFLSPCRLPTWL